MDRQLPARSRVSKVHYQPYSQGSKKSMDVENGFAQGAARWHEDAVERCRKALSRATSVADRLALLRSLTRLKGSRANLDEEHIRLSSHEHDALVRFGLALSGRVLRIVDE